MTSPRAGERWPHPPQDGWELEHHSAFHNSTDLPVVLAQAHFPHTIRLCKWSSVEGKKEGRKEGRAGGGQLRQSTGENKAVLLHAEPKRHSVISGPER